MKFSDQVMKPQKLKHEVKEKWLKALRSGEYKQGRNTLYNPDTDQYCCLGVLCELAFQERVGTI